MRKQDQRYNFEDVLNRLKRYCSYQERSIHDVELKLAELNVELKEQQQLIEQLVKEDYLNQERFARAFISGKVRIKKWGKNKIRAALKNKRVDGQLITAALTEINEVEYLENLQSLLFQKQRRLDGGDKKEKLKVYRYLIAKGYEEDLVYKEIDW